MDAAQARVAAQALRAWLQPTRPARAGFVAAFQAVRGSPSARKRPRSRDATSAPSRARVRVTPGGALSPLQRGGHSLSGSGMLNERGGLR